MSAGQSISDLLIQMKQQALSASDTSLDTASRQALNDNFQALLSQISSVVQNAELQRLQPDQRFDQADLLPSHRPTARTASRCPAENMSLSGSIVTVKSTGSISTQSKASTMVATVEASLNNVNSALAKLGAGAAKFSIQATFVQNLSDTLTTGIGNLVDANMATESAQLTALQTKQQLGVQALSIANQAPSIALSLFH